MAPPTGESGVASAGPLAQRGSGPGGRRDRSRDGPGVGNPPRENGRAAGIPGGDGPGLGGRRPPRRARTGGWSTPPLTGCPARSAIASSPPVRCPAGPAPITTACASPPVSATDRRPVPAPSTPCASRAWSLGPEAGTQPTPGSATNCSSPSCSPGPCPRSAQAQAARALISKLTDEECDQVTSMSDVENRARGR